VLDEGEQCDGDNFNGETCVTQGLPGGDLTCGEQCQLDLGSCDPLPSCGDSILNGEEECDNLAFSVPDCEAFNPAYGGGELTCNGNCTFDTTECCVQTGATCNGATTCCSGVCLITLLCL
jgi:hypothetical protein